MKKFNFRKSAIAVSAVMLSAALTGCGSGTDSENPSSSGSKKNAEPVNIAIVLGNHDNAYVQDLSLIADDVAQLYDRGGNLVVVVSDGNPEDTLDRVSIEKVDTSLSDANREEQITQNTNDLLYALGGYYAQASEVAALDAITVAANNLNAYKGEHIMVVLDTGFSTSGKLDLTQNTVELQNIQTEEIINNLKNSNNIPELNNYSIRWYGLNQPVSPQEKGTSSDEIKLKALWEGILNEGGATNIYFDSQTVSHEYWKDELPEGWEELPPVATVEVSTDPTPWPEEIETETTPDGETIITELNFPEEKFEFLGDSDEFVDPAQANENAKAIIEELNKYETSMQEIVLIGCTATVGDEEKSLDLSRRRAEAIRQLLIDNGIKTNEITCYGAGYSVPELFAEDVRQDTDENGKLIEDKAKQHRVVFGVSPNSEKVQLVQAYLDSHQ